MNNNDYETTDNEQMTKKSMLPWIILIVVLLTVVIAAVLVFNAKINKDKEKSNKESGSQNQQVMVQHTDSDAVEAINTEDEKQAANDDADELTENITENTIENTTDEANNIVEDSKNPETVEKHYMGVTYYLPAYFEKYVVVQETERGIVYYDEGALGEADGHLFSILYYSDSGYEQLPNYKIIGNDGGYTYVFYYPSDVQFDPANEAAAEEYQILANASNNIKAFAGSGSTETGSISASDKDSSESTASTGTSSDYILPNSNTEYLKESDISGMSENQLMLARNEIYARHGYIFNTQSIADYFAGKSWYNPSVPSDQWTEDMLNDCEKANIELIVKVETEKGYR